MSVLSLAIYTFKWGDKMNYTKMTDFEINKAVLKLSIPYEDICELEQIGHGQSVAWGDGYNWYNYDPCNSWADAGPIIEKHLICLAADVFAEPQDGGKWVAQPAYGWNSERVRSDNPLRAAMIVFLMMQEKSDE